MMSPLKVLLSIISLFVVLAIVAVVYPEGGIHVGDYTLRYPKLTDIFEKDSGKLRDSTQEDPEEAIREMMEATKRKEFAAFSDSLKYYENFFKKGKTPCTSSLRRLIQTLYTLCITATRSSKKTASRRPSAKTCKTNSAVRAPA